MHIFVERLFDLCLRFFCFFFAPEIYYIFSLSSISPPLPATIIRNSQP